MPVKTRDVAIVGGGPGGYVAAIRGAQLGLRVALIEREAIGGVCLNWGCVPSKALLASADLVILARRGAEFGLRFDRLEFDLGAAVDRSRALVTRMVDGVEVLLAQHHVEVIHGTAHLLDARTLDVDGERVEADHIVLATGARPRALAGIPFDGERVLRPRDALALHQAPGSIAVVGGGSLGVEFAYLFRACGAAVTLVEEHPHVLPWSDEEVCHLLERALRAQGIDLHTGTALDGASVEADGVVLRLGGDEPAEVHVECVLVCAGLTGDAAALGLEAAGVATEDGFVPVDDFSRTNVKGVFAIGDITGRGALAHLAMAQGVIAVETIGGRDPAPLVMDAVPQAAYAQPQVASIGLTQGEARLRGHELRIGRFPFRANGRALTLGEPDGLVKLVYDAVTDDLLGCHVLGRNATDLMGAATLGLAMGATVEDFTRVVLLHPTLTEAVREAALAAAGEAIHFVDRRVER